MVYKYIENFLSKEECEALIEFGNNSDLQRLTSVKQNEDGTFVESTDEDKLHKRSGVYFKEDELQTELLLSVKEKTLKLLNELNLFDRATYTDILSLTFNKYVEGDYLNLHRDLHEIDSGATITVLYQLNDDYDEGEVMYSINPPELESLPKKQGSIFLFEPNMYHAVSKIKKGVRYSLNAWPKVKIEKSLF